MLFVLRHLQLGEISCKYLLTHSMASAIVTSMSNTTLTITRESAEIYVATSESPYWSDGEPINARLAFNASGVLSSSAAQTIDRKNGRRYLLISPFGIRIETIIARVRTLSVGESVTIKPSA